MGKYLRITLLVVLILLPIIFYRSFNKKGSKEFNSLALVNNKEEATHRAKVALIFDDLGESLKELKEIYSLDIPLTIAVIPKLKFSGNIAHIGHRCGFSVLIHLPLAPEKEANYKTSKYRFIGSSLTKKEIDSLLRTYLNSIRVAIGVNNHMGSQATEEAKLMEQILLSLKKKGLIFIDSRTSLKSVAYDLAKKSGLVCGYNEGFLDNSDEVGAIEEKLGELLGKAKKIGKIIIIAHPKENTFKVLKKKIPLIKGEVEFVALKDYFER